MISSIKRSIKFGLISVLVKRKINEIDGWQVFQKSPTTYSHAGVIYAPKWNICTKNKIQENLNQTFLFSIKTKKRERKLKEKARMTHSPARPV